MTNDKLNELAARAKELQEALPQSMVVGAGPALLTSGMKPVDLVDLVTELERARRIAGTLRAVLDAEPRRRSSSKSDAQQEAA